ncbi:hypothetical protein GQ651_02915 [Alphaproteobacteria bacterium GH1-50]|uniref:Uncharacterized protein n=1 Tax=Kangsaoukella pontilimi TaxID=2691042 RepID=A0A7C9IMP0_9RHOB|nr:hypothetical protein [Kangsaoukella pontilimi]MXQ06790.1 hypothetical protein [Kangsaoukella pontilimi]
MAGEGGEHWTKMIRQNMEYPAWRALSPYAQALYPWIKLEWKGPSNNNNGRIQMSVRQAAHLLGCSTKTGAKALIELQQKGWIVVTQVAVLGVKGKARAHSYELTEIALPKGLGDVSAAKGNPVPRNLFRDWRPGDDFPVAEVRTNNPCRKNGI